VGLVDILYAHWVVLNNAVRIGGMLHNCKGARIRLLFAETPAVYEDSVKRTRRREILFLVK